MQLNAFKLCHVIQPSKHHVCMMNKKSVQENLIELYDRRKYIFLFLLHVDLIFFCFFQYILVQLGYWIKKKK